MYRYLLVCLALASLETFAKARSNPTPGFYPNGPCNAQVDADFKKESRGKAHRTKILHTAYCDVTPGCERYTFGFYYNGDWNGKADDLTGAEYVVNPQTCEILRVLSRHG